MGLHRTNKKILPFFFPLQHIFYQEYFVLNFHIGCVLWTLIWTCGNVGWSTMSVRYSSKKKMYVIHLLSIPSCSLRSLSMSLIFYKSLRLESHKVIRSFRPESHYVNSNNTFYLSCLAPSLLCQHCFMFSQPLAPLTHALLSQMINEK